MRSSRPGSGRDRGDAERSGAGNLTKVPGVDVANVLGGEQSRQLVTVGAPAQSVADAVVVPNHLGDLEPADPVVAIEPAADLDAVETDDLARPAGRAGGETLLPRRRRVLGGRLDVVSGRRLGGSRADRPTDHLQARAGPG